MPEITKPDFTYLWSSGGSKIAPSDAKIQTGWTAEVPPFQWENWAQNRQDQAIAHVLQHGISVWDATTDYQIGKSYVQGSDGLIYVAVQTNTNQNPVTDVTYTYWAKALTGGLLNIQRFDVAGLYVYTPTPGTKSVFVEVQAAGGGGGGAGTTASGFASAGAGGGAGGYSCSRLLTGFSGVTVTVGASGAGGLTTPTVGGNGGNSSFGSILSATGGSGGGFQPSTNTFTLQIVGAPGGSGAGGNVYNSKGGVGGNAVLTGAGNSCAGAGGDSKFSQGSNTAISTSAGTDGVLGSGGGGGVAQNITSGSLGGTGGEGFVLVWEFA